MKPKKPKKKEVTMWAIWSPMDKNIVINTLSFLMRDSWSLLLSQYNSGTTEKFLYGKGYRAVKGKFVWEEK